MNKPLIAVSLVALATTLPPAASNADVISISLDGEGVLVHEGSGTAEAAFVHLESLAANTFRAAPYTGVDGVGTLVVETASRTLELDVLVSGDVLARDLAGRHVETWTLGVGNSAGSGTLNLAGSDGFLHGAGSIEIFLPSGPNHGRFDLAFAGTAEIVH